MNRYRLATRLCMAALTMAALAAPAGATVPVGDEPGITVETVDVSSFPEVTLTVSPPPELAGVDVPASAFELTENGAPRDVRVTRLGAGGLAVVVVMDTSGSMRGEPIIASKAAALSFVNRLPEATNVAVVGFSDAPAIVSSFTTDRTAIATAIDGVVANGETALYDGVLAAVGLLTQSAADQQAIVLLSDGGDTVSAAPIEQVEDRVAASNAGLTAIELTTGETDRLALDRIARAASGRVVSVDDPEALNATYATIAERLSNLYELRFFSSGATRADLTVSVDFEGVQSEVLAPVEFPDNPSAPTATTVAEISPPKPFVESGPTLPGNVLLAVGLVLTVLGVAAAVLLVIGDRSPARRLADDYEAAGLDEGGMAWVATLASQAAAVGENLTNRGGQTATIDNRLDAAGLSMRAGEFVAVVAASAIGAAMFGFLVLGPLAFVVGGALPLVAAPSVLALLRDRRQARFADQLGDTLVLLSSSLRAGYGLLQAVDAVARETDAPMSTEFGRVVIETRLGRPLSEALSAVVLRMGSEDFEWVVEAIEIHQEVGGDLTEVLDHVGETIRARTRITRQVRALSAEGKISAIVLVALPFVLAVLISISSPDYINTLFDTTAGNLMVAGAIALLVVGGLWLRRIVKSEY